MQGYVLFGLVSILPAAGMYLIGMLSVGSVRRSLLLVALCGVWVALGLLLRDVVFGFLCLAQAAAGIAGWIRSARGRLKDSAAGSQPGDQAPPPPPPSPPSR